MEFDEELMKRKLFQRGAILLFQSDHFITDHPHFHVVLNHDPMKDGSVLLVHAQSNVAGRQEARNNCPQETLVIVQPATAPAHFSRQTVFDCNSVSEVTLERLLERYKADEVFIKQSLPQEIFLRLLDGVRKSPLHSPKLKKRI